VRRAYIDWLRGVAVMIMFTAHATDAWTRESDRGGPVFYVRDVISGFGAPLFLLLAGTAIAYSAASRVRKGATDRAASRQVIARGWQIFAIAFLFRLQMYVTSLFYRWRSLLKVDILNVMGPSIAAAGWVWGLARTARGKTLALCVPVIVLPFATPYIRGFSQLAVLPDPLEAYIRPAGTYAAFTLFPWAAFVFAGAAIGVVLERAKDGAAESRRVWTITALGAAIAASALALSYRPSPFPNSHFWTTSPAFFYLRTGILMAGFGLAWIWSEKLWRGQWQPLVLLGQTSLFVYWVHVELVYGYFTKPIYHKLPFWGSCAGVIALTVVMYYLAKNAKSWIGRQREAGVSDWRTKSLTVMGL
jgi:uncharacterized membrane protein